MTELTKGDRAVCSNCDYSAIIDVPVVELFGSYVGYGPGGPEDMFTESKNGDVLCYDCMENKLKGLEMDSGEDGNV